MDPDATQPKRRDNILSSLNVAIEVLNLAKEASSITPAKAVFGSVSTILTMIKVCISVLFASNRRLMERHEDSMINEVDYVELGLACADACTALDRGLGGKRLEELNNSVCDAITQLKT